MRITGLVDPTVGASVEPWLWAAAVGALLVGVLVGAVEGGTGRAPRLSILLSAIASAAILALGVALVVPGAAPVTAAMGRVLDFQPIAVRYDALAGIFVLVLGIVGLAASTAAWSGVLHAPFNAMTGAAYPAFLVSMLLVFGAADAFAFLLAWEVMALSSAALVIGARPLHEQVAAGYLYVAVTHLATAALVVAFGLLTATSGGSFAFVDWAKASIGMTPLARDAVFGLLVVGFGTKAGAIPVHVWLPRAHPAAPAYVSALMSGVMIKTGIFGLVRVSLVVLGAGPDTWGVTILVVGAVSAVLGVLYALMEHDLKRLLAFHSIENIGIILLGLGAAMLLAAHGHPAAAGVALAAALFHSLNHGVFKALLFLGAGAVQAAAGTRNLNRLGGLARGMPLTALCFGVGAAAISGLPPLNGFASEWLTFHGLIGAGAAPDMAPLARTVPLIAIGALALTAALAVACFVKATGMVFLALPRSTGAEAAHEAELPERLGMAMLAGLCVVLGIVAAPIAARLGEIASPLVGGSEVTSPSDATLVLRGGPAVAGAVAPALLGVLGAIAVVVSVLALRRGRRRDVLRAAPTWTCGIEPTAAMEYTSTGYSKLIRLFFRRVLLPEREIRVEYHPGTSHPSTIHYSGEVTHVLEEHVFGPLHALSVRASSTVRRIQNGSLQIYLAYALVGFVILLAVARG
jgi:hydrogenase-4 component B